MIQMLIQPLVLPTIQEIIRLCGTTPKDTFGVCKFDFTLWYGEETTPKSLVLSIEEMVEEAKEKLPDFGFEEIVPLCGVEIPTGKFYSNLIAIRRSRNGSTEFRIFH